MASKELWKPIEDYDSYLISNHGRVMNTDTGNILKPYQSKYKVNGITRYRAPEVTLHDGNGGRKNINVSTMAARVFGDVYDSGYVSRTLSSLYSQRKAIDAEIRRLEQLNNQGDY
ncbi:hypothetical protein G3R49_19305 [Shewanella sp. WXL01]|uniref:NUMOD4 domain-containing protein n=1 Tax=Shewanella sp. WXL01 TaxID=2709721 RepID=UPI0014384883|nr:NUMOD4 domain-containing protein [Shewanella sp. WXL01]NKF52707.1 hypothetical protein [Shewanella sp. WXL01]